MRISGRSPAQRAMHLFPCSACHRRSPAAKKRARLTDPAEIAEAVEKHRRQGNAYFGAKDFANAAAEYSAALRLKGEPALYLNRSIALRRLLRWRESAEDAAMAARIEPKNEKAHYAHAIALQHMNNLPAALLACEAGLAARPDYNSLLELKRTVTSRLAEQASAGDAKRKAAKAAPQSASVGVRKGGYCLDEYSKWDNFTDDEDEAEDADGTGEVDAGAGNGTSNTDGLWRDRTDEQRALIVEQFMQMVRESREKTHSEAGWLNFGDGSTKKITSANLPDDYRRHMGNLSVEQLGRFTCSNDRMLVSVYGDLFDVSGRSDLYGYGKNSWQAGKDITWMVITGKEELAMCNRFYDIFKAEEKELERMMRVVCYYLVWFRDEFGEPVGRLDKFNHERDLPEPPAEEAQQCPQQ